MTTCSSISETTSGRCFTRCTLLSRNHYNRDALPVYSPQEFKEHAPLFVIDCSRQNDTLKTGTVDIRLEIEASANFPANTAAYCLVIHDRLVTYNPLKNEVKIANTF